MKSVSIFLWHNLTLIAGEWNCLEHPQTATIAEADPCLMAGVWKTGKNLLLVSHKIWQKGPLSYPVLKYYKIRVNYEHDDSNLEHVERCLCSSRAGAGPEMIQRKIHSWKFGHHLSVHLHHPCLCVYKFKKKIQCPVQITDFPGSVRYGHGFINCLASESFVVFFL